MNFSDKRGEAAMGGYHIFLCVLLSSVLFPLTATHAAERQVVAVSDFGSRNLAGWQEKLFDGRTTYSFIEDKEKDWVLRAQSNDSASGLIREMRVDLEATPYLHWSWKIEHLPPSEDEKSKSGDDYAARLYVIFKTGPWFWNTKALNYVWSTTSTIGTSWPNAYTASARMLAVRSGEERAGEWIEEKRNVKADISAIFESSVTIVEAIAIMTDSDDTGGTAVAFYGDIYFSDR